MTTLEFIKSEIAQKFSNRFPEKKTEIIFGDLTFSFLHSDGVTLECVFEDGQRILNNQNFNGKGVSIQFTCAEKTPKGYISSKKINVNIKDKNDITLEEVTELLKFNTDAIKNTFDPFYGWIDRMYSKDNLREKRINDALRYNGLSVIIRNEDEFNHIKKFLGEDNFWVNFVPRMSSKLTSIVIWADHKDYSTGSVGCAESQKQNFIRVVEFNDYFKL